jgi:hypothetical protein
MIIEKMQAKHVEGELLLFHRKERKVNYQQGFLMSLY